MENKITNAEIVRRLKLMKGKTNAQAAAAIETSTTQVRWTKQQAKVRGLTAESPVHDPLESAQAELKTLRAALAATKREQESAARIREEIYGLSARTPPPPKWLTKDGKPGQRGTPFLLCSDWHYGEIVRPAQVGGVNEFNSEIADQRIERLFKSAVDLCFNHMGKPPVTYPGIVCALAGDIITGAIHPDQIETDATPLQQVRAVKKKIIQGLSLLADKFGKVYVPCVPGNHGRDTQKPNNSRYVWHSYEWNLYCQLEDHFKDIGDDRVQFDIPEETDVYFKVYGHKYLLTHGDNMGVKGGDGMIGALGPITRGAIKVGRSEVQIGRDFDTLVMGHWHQKLVGPGNGYIVNNALKGYDTFARLILRAPYTRPSQALWFTHPEHGITAHWDIYLDKLRNANENKKWVEFQR